jgi:hypothetical protein
MNVRGRVSENLAVAALRLWVRAINRADFSGAAEPTRRLAELGVVVRHRPPKGRGPGATAARDAAMRAEHDQGERDAPTPEAPIVGG